MSNETRNLWSMTITETNLPNGMVEIRAKVVSPFKEVRHDSYLALWKRYVKPSTCGGVE